MKKYKKRIKRVYKESDCASPCNEALRKLQVIDTFLPKAIDCVAYLFSLFIFNCDCCCILVNAIKLFLWAEMRMG